MPEGLLDYWEAWDRLHGAREIAAGAMGGWPQPLRVSEILALAPHLDLDPRAALEILQRLDVVFRSYLSERMDEERGQQATPAERAV